MAYLSDADAANGFLDETKLSFLDDNDAEPEAKQADAIVRAAVADLYDTSDWGGEDTPALIGVIAAMLMASMRYAKRYSEESVEENSFSARLWRQAMELLLGLRNGSLDLHDVETASSLSFTRAHFWPNDLTTNSKGEPIRAFSMEMEW